METVLPLELLLLFATYTEFPSAEMQITAGPVLVAIVLVPLNAPVDVFLLNIETVFDPLLLA
jgi:hypothetical protein